MDENDKQEDDIEIDETDETEDAAYWKELALKKQGMLKREKTKHEKTNKDFEDYKKNNPPKKEEPPKESPEKPEKSSDLDYGQKAFFGVHGVKGADELSLAKEIMEKTGLTPDSLIGDDYFQSRLTKLRDAKAAKEALPRDGRGSRPPAKDDVEAWMDKPFGEVPLELREKVLDARLERDKRAATFTDKPILM